MRFTADVYAKLMFYLSSRSPADLEICHLWAERPSSSCVPQGYESHSFLNQHGQMRTVHSITSCHCQN